jgi:hypothetical protein
MMKKLISTLSAAVFALMLALPSLAASSSSSSSNDTTDILILIAIGVGIGLIIALIVVMTMKAKLKSVKNRNEASDYVREGSFHLTSSSDVYLYRTVRRVAKPKNNN